MNSEGFCPACERLEPIADNGLIAEHRVWYTEFGKWHQVTCRGTGVEPGELPKEM